MVTLIIRPVSLPLDDYPGYLRCYFNWRAAEHLMVPRQQDSRPFRKSLNRRSPSALSAAVVPCRERQELKTPIHFSIRNDVIPHPQRNFDTSAVIMFGSTFIPVRAESFLRSKWTRNAAVTNEHCKRRVDSPRLFIDGRCIIHRLARVEGVGGGRESVDRLLELLFCSGFIIIESLIGTES